MPRNARAAATPAANTAAMPATAALEARIAALTAELRDSEERHERIIAAVAEGIYDWDIERNTLTPSSRLIDIFGLRGRELRASDWNVLVHPDDFPRYRAALRDCFQGQTPRLDCEYRVRHNDGAYRWIEDRALPVRNADGRAIRLTGAITDVTARKATEQALRDNEERYSLVSEAVAEGIYDWNVEQNTLYVSARLMEIFRFDGAGLSSEDWYGLVHADDRERYRSALRTCFKGQSPRVACEYRILLRNGEYHWVEDHGLPIRNAAGRAIRLVGAVSDVTERKAAEQALRESLDYQTATSDVLKVISRSTFDLQRVLATVAETAARLCDAEMAWVSRRDGDVFRYLVSAGSTPQTAADATEFQRAYLDANSIPALAGRRTMTGRVVAKKGAVQIADIAADSEYDFPETIQIAGIRSLLGVPLLREGEPVGVITLARQRVEPFTERQIELVRTLADQAVIAIENARLITETQEALAQQTATAEVLQVINASPGDLAPVFDTMLDKALRLCEADIGTLWAYDGELMHPTAIRSPSLHFAEYLRQSGPRRPARPQQPLLRGERIVQVADLVTTEGYRDGDPLVRAVVDLGGVRTVLNVALRKDDMLLGLFAIYRREVRPFTDKQIALLENFAAQAVIAMENARLITETREALEQQTATTEVLQVINSSPGELAPVFDAILEKAHALCGATRGTLFLFDGETFRAAAMQGYPEAPGQQPPAVIKVGEDPRLAALFAGERLIHTPDLTQIDDPIARAVAERGGVRTNLLLPLRKDGALLGVISCNRQEVRTFSAKEIGLLENFATQAVIAIENARLLGELRERTHEIEEALEYQTATSNVLQVISRSADDLPTVFETIVATAARLCNAQTAFISSREEDAVRIRATFAVSPRFESFIRGKRFPLSRENVAGRTALEGRVVQVPDITNDPEFKLRESITIGKLRTVLGVPLSRGGNVVGVITLGREWVEAFTEQQIELVRTFADQAVIAIENTRLITETREALEQQQAIAEVLGVINASPGELDPVFEAMLERAGRLCEAQTSHLLRYENGAFSRIASLGVSEDFDKILPLNTPVPHIITQDSVPYRMLASRAVVHVHDLHEDASVRAGAPAETMAMATGIRTLLFVPLLKEGVVVGCFVMHRLELRPFSDKQIALLENFAAQAVIAMDNARLLQEIRQTQAELRVTFDNMGDGVAMFDAELRLAAWNMNFQKILDLPDEFVAQRPTLPEYFQYMSARGEYGSSELEEELRRGVAIAEHEARFERTRPDGRVIEVRRNAVPGGGSVLIFSDITERKRSEVDIRAARDAAEAALRELKAAQAQLIHTEKMASLGQLTAGIAHEIKNPLNFVNNFATLSIELLDELNEMAGPGIATLESDTRADIDETIGMLTSNLDKIAEHGRRADGIVKSMLAHSRGSSGERQRADLNAMVDEALNLAYHGARAQDPGFNITLERDYAPLAPIEVVPQDITRVFLNLIGNGFYAATKRRDQTADPAFRPALKVTTRELRQAVEIAVRDNGIGIAPELRDKLFQPFFTTKPTGEGTGLGLSISYDIVTQEHGGTIAVDSRVGEFTEFTVRLPRNAPTAREKA